MNRDSGIGNRCSVFGVRDSGFGNPQSPIVNPICLLHRKSNIVNLQSEMAFIWSPTTVSPGPHASENINLQFSIENVFQIANRISLIFNLRWLLYGVRRPCRRGIVLRASGLVDCYSEEGSILIQLATRNSKLQSPIGHLQSKMVNPDL
jgi:hypothetical protein